MTVEEVIEVVRALPANDVRSVIAAAKEDLHSKLEREFAAQFPPGAVLDVWSPQLDVADMQAFMDEIERMKIKVD